jgi:nucleoside-diphosphate-sugar epimerase
MSRLLATGGPGFVGSRVILRLLTAGREVRTVVESPTRRADVPAMATPDAQPRADVSFIASARDLDAERLDAVAGSEYLDDRIRLRE